jgi:hypothetical protein
MPFTRITRRVPLEYLSLSPDSSGVHVIQSLVLCLCFVDRFLSFCTFSFGHCVDCSSSIYYSGYPFSLFKLFLGIDEVNA